jgi:hypothetical protein
LYYRDIIHSSPPNKASPGVDLIFGRDIADYNAASLKAFQKVGYTLDAQIEQPKGKKAQYCYDLVLARADALC